MKMRIVFLLICLCVVSCGFIALRAFLVFQGSAGWIQSWKSPIAIHKSLPLEFGGFTPAGNSLYLSLENGNFYRVSQKGDAQWSFSMQDYTIYPPAFDGNVVYISSFDGRLYALDRRTGKELWRFTTPDYLKADTEPRISEGLVYFGSRNGTFYALNKNTGKVVWQFITTPIDRAHYTPGETIIHFGRFSVDDTAVYINSATNNTLYALDKTTGTIKWRLSDYGFAYLRPRIFANSVSIWNDRGEYILLDKRSGTQLFKIRASPDHLASDTHYTYIILGTLISAINNNNGQRIWTRQDPYTPQSVHVIQDGNVSFISDHNGATYLSILDGSSGRVLWLVPTGVSDIKNVINNNGLMYVLGGAKQCAWFSNTGKVAWCTTIPNSTGESYFHPSGIYVISKDGQVLRITDVDTKSGNILWQYASDIIHPDYIRELGGDIYFLTRDRLRVVKINHAAAGGQISTQQLQKRFQFQSYISFFAGLWKRVQTRIIPIPTLGRRAFTITEPEQIIKQNHVAELTFSRDDIDYKNAQHDVNIRVTFTGPNETVYTVSGFYFDKNTWKVRFIPGSTGDWQWKATIKDSSYTQTDRGNFHSISSTADGFLSISSVNPHLFTIDYKTEFYPIGMQDCIRDENQDGDPLEQWFPGIKKAPPVNPVSLPAYSMNDYLSLYRESGVNLWRWGAGNCAQTLWKELSPDGNRYALNEGYYTDMLFESLKRHGYHIWMSLFSFTMPFNQHSQPGQRAILKDYLDYVVARYGAYVDVWELANEIDLTDAEIRYMSTYIRSIDPYHHPITTSWQRPNNTYIDINSLHWYDTGCNIHCDINIDSQINPYKELGKPTVFSEIGNRDANWDATSADRLRILLWIGFMKNISMIYWNTATSYYVNPQGTSNIYLGPTEREYVSVFSRLIKSAGIHATQLDISSSTMGVNIFSQLTSSHLLIYLYRGTTSSSAQSASFYTVLPFSGNGQWIDPKSGRVIKSIDIVSGNQTITSPSFSSDLVFKLSATH